MTNSRLRHHAARLLVGTAIAAIGGTAYAQDEIVTVTGTSIRGQAPVGASIIQIDRASIAAQGAQTAQQLLANVPQLAGFGNAAQGQIGSFDGAGTQAPTIHSLGASASNSTLILIDGHRIPLSGLNHTLADPSIIPAAAIQRVEILPDGASSIYGSDAMAGVLNFITRKDYDGWETSGQYGFGDSYTTAQASQLFGKSWEGGSLLAVYNFSNRDRLANGKRDFITARQDLRRGSPSANPNTGGANFNDFNCSPATIAVNNTSTSVFAHPYTGTALSTATAAQQGICNRVSASSQLPSENRQIGMVALRQSLDERLSLNVDLVYSARLGTAAVNRGTLNATAFGPTATAANTGIAAFFTNQRNPFYTGNATTGTNSQFVRYDFEDLYGNGANQKSGATDIFATMGLDYDIGGGWMASLGTTFGYDLSFQRTQGQVNNAAALLALNGTAVTTGNPASNALADPYGLGTTVTVTRSLTTANALDVWNPAASNRTSDAVRRSLLDSSTNVTSWHNMRDVMLKVDGPLFALPAGDVKVAAGGEYIHYTLNQANSTLNATGPASTSSRFLSLKYARTVYAAFAEAVFPLVNADMGIPLIQKFDLNLAGRYDNYSDFGTTENPKVGFTWTVTDGLTARGTYGTSFTAPALTSSGQPGTGVTGETSVVLNGATNNTLIPTTWTGSAGTWVNTEANCIAGGRGVWVAGQGCRIQTATATGIQINGGNAGLQPSRGLSYSAGIDISGGSLLGDMFEGLDINFTYWQAKYMGLITAPAFDSTVGIPQLQANTVFAPPGGWSNTDPYIVARTSGRPLNAALPATIWYVFDFTQQNAFNIQANGIDWTVNYRLPTSDMGTFIFTNAGGMKLRFDQNSGPTTGPWTNFLNGVNRSTTFNAIAWTMRTSIGWSMDPFTAQFSWNFVNAYHARNSNPPNNAVAPDGSRLAGYEHISPLNSFDLNLGYNLPEDWLSGTQANLTITNLFDVNPPFSNQINGYDGGNAANGNPLGRIVTIGLTKKW